MHYRKKTILNKRNNEVSCRDQLHILGLVGCRFQSFSLRLFIVLEITIHVRYYYVLRIVHACFLRIASKHFGNMGKAGIRYHQLHLGLTIHSTALSKPFIIVTLRQFNIHLAGKTRFWQRRKFRAISPLWSATDFHVRLRLRSSGTSGISKDARRTWMNSALWLWYSTKPWKALELEMAGLWCLRDLFCESCRPVA